MTVRSSDHPGASVLITVIVAVRNGEATLQRCIDSVASQRGASVELIVMDGASTDGTRLILEANRTRIAHFESAPDRGIYDAWNKGLAHARGQWIYFLGADDWFTSDDVLSGVSAHLRNAYPKHRIVYGRVQSVDREDRILETRGEPWSQASRALWSEMPIPHQGVFQHRSIFEEHGAFDISFRIAGDYDLLLPELRAREPLFLQDVIVAAMGYGGISSLPQHNLRSLREFRRAQRHRGRPWPTAGWLWLYVKGLGKMAVLRIAGEPTLRVVSDCYRRLSGRTSRWHLRTVR